MSVREFQGIFSLLPSVSGTYNHTQTYNAVNTSFLKTEWNRREVKVAGSYHGEHWAPSLENT